MSLPALRIGRNDDNDVTLADNSISGYHAEIHRKRDGTFIITDLDSKNGVLLNDYIGDIAELKDGGVETFEVEPEDAGLPRAEPRDLKGADPDTNARATRALLDGERGPIRNFVLYNSAAALVVASRADDLKAGVALAEQAIDSGAARTALDRLIEITNQEPPAGKPS